MSVNYGNDERTLMKRKAKVRTVRFRTLGCYPLTGAIKSNATTLEQIIDETLSTNTSERQGRLIDIDSSSSMEEKRKRYF